MKKTLAILLIFVFNFNFLSIWVNATYEISYKNEIVKQLIISKTILDKTYKWRKYVNIINNFIEKNKYNKQLLLKISNNIYPLLEEWKIKNSETLNIIKYMNGKIKIALINILEEEKNDVYKENISATDKKLVEDEIVKLQLNLFNKSVSYFDTLIDDFEKLTNYEDNGDFNMSLNVDHEKVWKIDSTFSFEDYSIKASNFDSELKWQINALINASIEGEEEFKLKLSWFIDFISKDGNIYMLLEKLNITDKEWTEQIEEYLEKLEQIASENKYIKYEDKDSKQALEILNSITPAKIISNWKNILSKPMFEAYKKDWDKYLLKPTKYACDTAKELANKFDPFNGSKCTDGQYKDMLNDLAEVWYLYITIWGNNKIGFSWKADDDTKFTWFIVFDDTKILEINAIIIPDQNEYPDEWFELNYKNNNNLYINLYAESWDINYKFNSTLDRNNNFTYIDFVWLTNSKYQNFEAKILLKNKIITWNISINNSRYDWNTGDSIPSNTVQINIDWTTNYKNILSTLNIDTTSIDLKDNSKNFTSDFRYKQWEIAFNLHAVDWYTNADLEFYWKWDTINKVLTEWNIDLSIKEKDYYSEDDNYNEVFNTNINLNNKIISGNTYLYDWEFTTAKISHSGKYEKDYFKLNNIIEMEENPLSMLWFWNPNESKTIINLNFETDLRNNAQNLTFYSDLSYDSNKIFEFNLKNTAKRTYKETIINTPTNIIDFSELINN